MAKRPLPTPEELRQLLRYEPETGNLFWLPRSPHWFGATKRPLKYAAQAWNNRHAGKECFTSAGTDGYLYGNLFQRSVSAHRVIVAMQTGEWPEHYVDHINGNRLDNRIANLRAVTPLESARNLGLNRTNKTGKPGVDYVASRADMPWRARISDNGVGIMLGWYRTKEEAIAAREAAEKVLGFHPNHGRLRPLTSPKHELRQPLPDSPHKRTSD